MEVVFLVLTNVFVNDVITVFNKDNVFCFAKIYIYIINHYI